MGSINADFQLRVRDWPEPGETLPGREFALLPGGKAANVACLVRRLGAPAMLFGCVGRDALADIALSGPREAGVDLTFVRSTGSAPTGAAMVAVREDGDKTILMADNANAIWRDSDTKDMLSAICAAERGSVMVADLEAPVAVVEQAAAAARERGFKVVIDPSPADRMSARLYELADVLTPNAAEAARLAGDEASKDGEQIAKTLRRRTRGAVVLKASHGDSVLASDGAVRRFNAIPARAVDTTGAGDAFAAALVVGLLEERSLDDSVLMGMAAASLAVERYGAQDPSHGRAELNERLARLKKANGL